MLKKTYAKPRLLPPPLIRGTATLPRQGKTHSEAASLEISPLSSLKTEHPLR